MLQRVIGSYWRIRALRRGAPGTSACSPGIICLSNNSCFTGLLFRFPAVPHTQRQLARYVVTSDGQSPMARPTFNAGKRQRAVTRAVLQENGIAMRGQYTRLSLRAIRSVIVLALIFQWVGPAVPQ